MGIGDDPLQAGQVAGEEAAQKPPSTRSVLAGGNVETENLPLPGRADQGIEITAPVAVARFDWCSPAMGSAQGGDLPTQGEGSLAQ